MTALHSEAIASLDASSSLVLALSAPLATTAAIAGGKASRLAALIADGHPVPPGFVITTQALDTVIATLPLPVTADAVRCATLPESLQSQIRDAYAQLGGRVAVRSSGVAEDLENASFAGQYETIIDVEGADAVLDAVRQCVASAFTERVSAYRAAHDIVTTRMAVLVQRRPTSSGRCMMTLLQARAMTALPEPVTWTAPHAGAWLRNFRLGEWIGAPVTPLFESWLLTDLERGMHNHWAKPLAGAAARCRQRLVLLRWPTQAQRRSNSRSRLVYVTWDSGYTSARVQASTPALGAVRRIMTQSYARDPSVLPILGGSLPLFHFVDALGATVITVPMVNADDRQHAPNENLCIKNLWGGIVLMTYLMAGLGREGPATMRGVVPKLTPARCRCREAHRVCRTLRPHHAPCPIESCRRGRRRT